MIDRRRPWPEAVALLAAVCPTAVIVGRAATSGWVPLFDAAYFTVRSRDVLGPHHPDVGAWSMGSRSVGESLNNLGPLQLDVLAPFTAVDPYWGTALGVGATNVAAIVGVWLVARRLLSRAGARARTWWVIAAMAATVVLQLNEGSLMLIEARQQLALVLPLWLTLWVAAGVWAGDAPLLPWLALTASFVVQTHFTYLYPTAAVAVASTVALVVRRRRALRSLARPVALTFVVAAACWFQPLRDQVRGTGNLGRVLDQRGAGDDAVGFTHGIRILADTGLLPPFFTPGSMGSLLRPSGFPSLAPSAIAAAGWIAALVVVAIVAGRGPVGGSRSALAGLAAVSTVALTAAVHTVRVIPPTEEFGIVRQNYYWVWPIGIMAMTVLVAAAVTTLHPRLDRLPRLHRPLAGRRASWGAAALVALAAVPLLRPTNLLPETAWEWDVSIEHARPLIDQFGNALDELVAAGELDGPVAVDLGTTRHVRYTMLAELQRVGVDFRFPPGSIDLARFGHGRCDDGSAGAELILDSGAGALQISGRGRLLAAVPGLTDVERRRSAELAADFGDHLRSGAMVVDDEAAAALGLPPPTSLQRVRTIEGLPATALGSLLHGWYVFGAAAVDDDGLVADLAEWAALHASADRDRMAIYLRPLPTDRPNHC